jgi:hypothetical protein
VSKTQDAPDREYGASDEITRSIEQRQLDCLGGNSGIQLGDLAT